MLSIQFKPEADWWVSGKIFDRLFQSALDSGTLAPQLEEWRHVANANGGLNLARVDPSIARELTAGLRATAQREIARVGDAAPTTEDGSYKVSLMKLLQVS